MAKIFFTVLSKEKFILSLMDPTAVQNIVKPHSLIKVDGFDMHEDQDGTQLFLGEIARSESFTEFYRLESPVNPNVAPLIGKRGTELYILHWSGTGNEGKFHTSSESYGEIYYDKTLGHLVGKIANTLYLIDDRGTKLHDEGFTSIRITSDGYVGTAGSSTEVSIGEVKKDVLDSAEYW